MTCVEKRHMSHRVGSMLHHRFPNGFTDLLMDETDREVSTLTDRAFRSLCVGDDAAYNDEFLYGYSPFNCHKPLVGEPLKKTHKESKKQGQNKKDKNYAQQQHKNISHISSFLKALSATEESREGMLIKNGGMPDTNGESWDKSALRSIQRELSDFSSDYHTNLTDGHYKNRHRHRSVDGSPNKAGKDAALPSEKFKKSQNGKSTVKLRKLHIKNFFLHSEFSPFQSWRDFKQFPFGREETSILPTDNIPKWYDLPFYKELTEAHRKETQHTEEAQSCQKAAPPLTAPKPIPPPPPPKVLPKPIATPADKRCSSDGGDGSAAPWRRNRSRAKSVIPVNQPGIPPQENSSKTLDESLWLLKKEARCVEVKAVEEVSSLASTPFSICQLMTPLIPSRQPTETSEILQTILSPAALDFPQRPHSEAKLTPEPPVKRDSYKSLASSILFNLKDNRKRVKSRYNSPPKFKTSEVPEGGTQTPQSDHLKYPQAGSEGYASGLSTPAILKDGHAVCSPVLESNSTPTVALTKHDTDGPLSDDYLLSNLLQTKRDAAGSLGEENPISPFTPLKKTKSPKAKKQNYPSLNLYKKASPVDSDMKYLLVPPTEANEFSPLTLNKDLSPKALPTNNGFSPSNLNVNKERSPIISPHALEKEWLSSNVSVGKRAPNVPDKAKRPVKDIKEKDFSSKEKDTCGQPMSTMDVIKAAREAISAAKNKALSATQSDSINKPISDTEELREKEIYKKVAYSKEMFGSKRESSIPENNVLYQSRNEATLVDKKGNVKKEPPPVPKRNFAKSDIQLCLDTKQKHNDDKLTNGDSEDAKLNLSPNENESVQKQAKLKNVFSARQNNYIKHQRCAVMDDEEGEEFQEGDLDVDKETMPLREMRDSGHIINDLHALKELERARLGDRVLENAKKKLSVLNLDEEARAKNDLISRELRNIKKGMLSMRGNTTAKKELFAQKEKDQSKQETFTKIDANVIVNKALINDNYDRAKMALEEIISDRQKRKNKFTEQDANPIFDENTDESYVTRVEQRKNATKDSMTEAKEKLNGSTLVLKEKDLKERLSDLRDHNHMRQILSQNEPRLGETHRSGGRLALPGIDKIDDPSFESDQVNLRNIVRQISEESGENRMNQNDGKKGDVPPVPPRSKKGGSRRDGSVSKDTDSLRNVEEEDIFNKDVKSENDEVRLKEMRSTGSGKQQVYSDQSTRESSQHDTSPVKERWDVVNTANSKSITLTDGLICDSILPSKYPQSENRFCFSPEFKGNAKNAINLQADMSPIREAIFENSNVRAKETPKVKRKAPLRPDHLNTPDDNVTNNLVAEEPNKTNRAIEEINVDADALGETHRDILSPLLLVNGKSVNQSPPDQASLSSKSSYFSVESTLNRNTETESNVYHSLENLIGEEEEVDEATRNSSRNTKQDSDRTEAEYYSLSDHESEPVVVKRQIKSPQKETEVLHKDSKERDNTTSDQSVTYDENNPTPMSPSNTFSLSLGIPALFKVKDITLSNKLIKTVQPWPPKESLSGSERVEELDKVQENPELPLANEPATRGSTPIPDEIFKPKEIPSKSSPPLLLSPLNLQSENPKKPQAGGFLTVPQEEDRLSGVSPSSEGVESLTASTADTADEMGKTAEVSKVPSERSGSTCSGNESQTGLPKPPVVLPKSEKAVLKAIKLANRRMKKEEAQKSSHRSSQSGSKHRVDRHNSDKPEHKSSSSRSSESSERNHREKTADSHRHSESHHGKTSDDQSEQIPCERRGHSSENHNHERTHMRHKTRRESHDSVVSSTENNEALPSVATERQGRSSNRHIRDKPEQRPYSSDRVISNVPVYKAQLSERPTTDRPINRSQSIDRYLGDQVERRPSADTSVNEKLDPRTQRIEKSIMDELQQRGRAREKSSVDTPIRRSHSIDSYPNPNPHPSTLSRQSSHTSQLSRQSSIEHAIVTQSFPMTQRKLLQDPDSGQYFFVDMPVQVKTKTFFDPETGSYVQLPVQPPEGAVPQASPLEVLTQPLVVYHSFVPVPLSPMAQKAPIQASHMEPRLRQMHCKDGHPYLEPVYGQHDHMLGEFLGTEEVDCPS
ncbi:cardiac-enriched FHL2-interacting protein [Sander lucioperca]|uniref:DUF4585 domain-containing protein n=1 Tax=Sander lucioperca TaxID=283035 RepID=A0A8D0ADK5_SANLU|nr:cardiac-enriched FHL2-interacting protein [Sander lucioperca]XP_031151197.1 cardiac-enriched FHL2-interacting protein [Sander lucioperca]XP_031151198.1 cardiac-enriched FHL2-interacting protein [Sander lucioperca]XP_031151199.1 cardiac-enriched FHL2-interacting protein [Sander lucioperca]